MVKIAINIKLIILILLFSTFLGAKDLQKVSLQLQWLDQFQFAGYYMAKEKGFYKKAGLDVTLKKFNNKIIPIDEVLNKRATYGIGRSYLIVEKSKGKDIKLLASIFQSSPSVLIVTKDSGIKTVKDFIGKRIMITSDVYSTVAILAMQNREGVSISDMIVQKYSFNVDDLIDKKTDIYSAYISNEPFLLKQRGVKYNIFDPKDYGFDIYSDILFTSSDELENHKQRALNFKRASLKGWEYAFNHIDETVEIIFQKYNTQNKSKEALKFEAQELKKLAYYNNAKLGNIDKNKIQRIYDIYNIMGLVDNKIDIDKFIVKEDKKYTLSFTKEEKEYLKNKKELSVCVQKNYLPYEGFKNGKFIGISSDILNLISAKLSIPLKITVIQNKYKSYEKFKSAQFDIKPVFPKDIINLIPYVATQPYLTDTIALVTRIEKPFIYDLSTLADKEIVMVKGFRRFIKYIKLRYPNIKLQEVEDMDTAMKLVASGKVFGYIGTALTSSYLIQERYSSKLKIVNNFNSFKLGFGVLKSEPHLLNILNKVMDSISENEKQKVYNKWIVTTVEKEPNYTIFWQLSGLFLLLLIIILFFYNRQRKLKNSLSFMVEDATKELEERNKNMHILLDTTMEAVLIFDENYNTIEVNQVAIDIFKFDSFADMLESKMFDFIPKDEQNKAEDALSQNNKLSYETKLYKKDKSIFSALVRGSDMVIDNKIYRIMTAIDLTEVKEKEKQLLQQTKLAQMGDMISMIAHQWRQPLNAISAAGINLSLLSSLNKLEDKKVQESSKFIENQTQKMSTTIDTFMNFVKPAKESKEFKLSHCVDDVMQIMGTQLVNHNIQVNIDKNNENISIVGYKDLLEQVVINLLSNARDAFEDLTIANKYINITIDEKDNIPIITIEDNAGGIPSAIQDKIFNPYFTTKEQGKGTGIGLYMSLDIVEKSFNGDLIYKPIKNGSRFEIILK